MHDFESMGCLLPMASPVLLGLQSVVPPDPVHA